MHPGIVPEAGGGQVFQEFFPVTAALEDSLALVAARGDMVKGTGIADSQGPSRLASLSAMCDLWPSNLILYWAVNINNEDPSHIGLKLDRDERAISFSAA
jgi:hypothetical protein